MLKPLTTALLVFFFAIIVPPLFFMFNYSQTPTPSINKMVYELPYPGLLPDSPLYKLKQLRDGALEFATRDNLKKSELHLLMSDKLLRTAQMMSSQKKNKFVAPALLKSEKYFSKSVTEALESKKQGRSANNEFIDHLKMSNAKHEEVLAQIVTSIMPDQKSMYKETVELNRENKKSLGGL